MYTHATQLRNEDNALTPRDATIAIEQATGFLVVSWWRDKTSVIPPYKGGFDYAHFKTLREAEDAYNDYENNEYVRAEPVALMACKQGVPFATLHAASPALLSTLIAGDAA
jgi:hypothetical protein